MAKQFKLGIAGLGGMGNWHRETIARIDGISVKGSFDINPARQEFAREHGLAAYDSLDAMLADPEIDIVLCATPNDLHKDIVVRTLRAGKHAVCEKPVAVSSADLAEMTAAAVETGRVFVVHQNRRWDEDYLTVKRLLDERALGEVFRVESRVHGSRGIPGDWRQEPSKGGGMVLDWGVHLFDQILLMFPGKVNRVRAALTHITNELVDDGFCAELEFASGATALVEVGTSNFISLPRWYVLGRDGTAVIPNWERAGTMTRVTDWDKNDAVPIRTAAGLTKTMAPRTDATIKTEPLKFAEADIRDFYRNVMDAIEGRAPVIVKLPENARVMRLMEAVFESAAKKQTMAFEA